MVVAVAVMGRVTVPEMAVLWCSPDAMCRIFESLRCASSVGCSRSTQSPRPSWPWSLAPHAKIDLSSLPPGPVPPSSTTWRAPSATCDTRTDGSRPSTNVGVHASL